METSIHIIIKPGFIHAFGHIFYFMRETGWILDKVYSKTLLKGEAYQLYDQYRDRPCINEMVDYMSSDVSLGLLFTTMVNEPQEKLYAEVKALRDAMRKIYGVDVMRNVLHVPDTVEQSEKEHKIYMNWPWRS